MWETAKLSRSNTDDDRRTHMLQYTHEHTHTHRHLINSLVLSGGSRRSLEGSKSNRSSWCHCCIRMYSEAFHLVTPICSVNRWYLSDRTFYWIRLIFLMFMWRFIFGENRRNRDFDEKVTQFQQQALARGCPVVRNWNIQLNSLQRDLCSKSALR